MGASVLDPQKLAEVFLSCTLAVCIRFIYETGFVYCNGLQKVSSNFLTKTTYLGPMSLPYLNSSDSFEKIGWVYRQMTGRGFPSTIDRAHVSNCQSRCESGQNDIHLRLSLSFFQL